MGLLDHFKSSSTKNTCLNGTASIGVSRLKVILKGNRNQPNDERIELLKKRIMEAVIEFGGRTEAINIDNESTDEKPNKDTYLLWINFSTIDDGEDMG